MNAPSLTLAVLLLLVMPSIAFAPMQTTYTPLFDGVNAYSYLEAQCDFGPRPPGSANLSLCRAYIKSVLESFGWIVTLQNFTYKETECANIVVSWTETSNTTVLLGAHYDTRPNATEDPIQANHNLPILGANDGASGVAVLMELARVLPMENRSGVKFVFFDAEDSGYLNGWDWIRGSTYFVSELNQTERDSISAMILLDIVGDANLRLPKETSSTDSLQNIVWNVADEMGYGHIFLGSYSTSILDDHRPFLDAGIPALDIIQVPFPWYWHTLEDTPDKCSAGSLSVVGRVLEVFISGGTPSSYPLDQPILLYAGLAAIALILVSYTVIRFRRR